MPPAGPTPRAEQEPLPGLHVALIMDGNGRWAKQRGLPRTLGHRAGVEALKRTVQAAPKLGVDRLTVFGFSTENWRRPPAEVSALMDLMRLYIEGDLDRLVREGVRIHIMGRRAGLPGDILEMIDRAESRSAGNDSFTLQVAFNYGGQADIVDAARVFAAKVARGEARPEDLDETSFAANLSTASSPPPDLIVRTSGERRISNFLLWECAYAELVFQDVLWPDYGGEALSEALADFRSRERRYGGIGRDGILAAG
ncbi:MAG: uppS [Caulobacteraceae bacterium]|nr:uppS [Caulobacteraceae bacterium]